MRRGKQTLMVESPCVLRGQLPLLEERWQQKSSFSRARGDTGSRCLFPPKFLTERFQTLLDFRESGTLARIIRVVSARTLLRDASLRSVAMCH